MLIALFTFAAGSVAHARSVALFIEGPAARELTLAVERVLASSSAELQLESSAARARTLAADVLVLGHAGLHSHHYEATLSIVPRSGSSTTLRLRLPARRPNARLLAAHLGRLVELVASAAGAPRPVETSPSPELISLPPPTSPSRSPSPSDAPASLPAETPLPTQELHAAPSRGPTQPILTLWLDGEIGSRRFTYNQRLTQNLAQFQIPAVPLIGGGLELAPFSRLHIPVIRDLSLVARAGGSVYSQSMVSGSTTSVGSRWIYFDAGLRYRVALGRETTRAVVGLSLSAGGQSFTFENLASIGNVWPSVSYVHVEPALDLRVPLWRFTFSGQFGYRAILSTGDFDRRFPHQKVGGIDAQAGVALGLNHGFEVRASAEYVRVFYDFRPRPGEPFLAGGALDEYLVGQVALAYAR